MVQIDYLFNLIKKHKYDEFIEYLNKNEDIDINEKDVSGNYLIH